MSDVSRNCCLSCMLFRMTFCCHTCLGSSRMGADLERDPMEIPDGNTPVSIASWASAFAVDTCCLPVQSMSGSGYQVLDGQENKAEDAKAI